MTAGAALAQSYNDPVWDLQQALQFRTADLADPTALKNREVTLEKSIQQLHTVGELRRALLLTGWRDEVNPLSTFIGDVRVGKLKESTELVVEMDREARKKVGERLAKQIQEEATRGDATTRQALAQLMGEMGTNVRALGDEISWKGEVPGLHPEPRFDFDAKSQKYTDWRGYARRFTPVLVKLTKDPNPSVRVAAARALGKINPDVNEAVPALQNMLRGAAVSERRAAAEGLLGIIQEIGKLEKKGRTQTGVEAKREEILEVSTAVAPAAGQGLDDRDPIVRRLSLATLLEAANSLSNLIPEPFDTKNVPPRNAPLTESQRKLVSALAAKVRQNEEALEPLTKLLAAQGERLGREVHDPDPEARLLARRVLEFMANSRLRMRRRWESLPELKTEESAQLDRGGPRGEIVLAVAQAKAATDEKLLIKGITPGLTALTRQLQDRNPVIRRAAVDFLEMLEEDAAPAVPLLISSLSDPDIFVRWSSARTLGRLNAKAGAQAVPALAKSLGDPDLDVRVTAAGTLEAYGPTARAAVPALADALGRGDPEFHRAIMYALQAIGPEASKAALPKLIAELRNEDARVRRTAAETLGHFGAAARNAIPALRLALHDDDADVRQAASDAILGILPAKG